MSESEFFFRTTAAILLVCVAFNHPKLADKLGRSGFLLILLGAMIPLLDLAILYLLAGDRIRLLTSQPLFSGLYYGIVLIASAGFLMAIFEGGKKGGRIALYLLTGYGVTQFLAFITLSGVPVSAPFGSVRAFIPIFPKDHLLLIGILIFVLVFLEFSQKLRRYFFQGGIVLISLYFLAGVGQYALISIQARPLAESGEEIHVEPANDWLTRWRITISDGQSYRVREHGLDLPGFSQPELYSRYNNETLLVKLLGDPVIHYFYYSVFRHPIANIVAGEAQTTLLIRELSDQMGLAPGPTFYFEWDLDGQHKLYQVARFD